MLRTHSKIPRKNSTGDEKGERGKKEERGNSEERREKWREGKRERGE